MWQLILYTVLSGVVGTGIGGIIGLFFKNKDRTVGCVLSFAGGIMVSIVCFDLFPEAVEAGGVWILAASAVGGMLAVALLNKLLDRRCENSCGCVCCQPGLAEEASKARTKRELMKAGVVLLLAFALHNLPEGLALGAGMRSDPNFGFKLMILMAAHNVPEGISIAVPLVAGGMKKWKAVVLTALSAVPALVGGLIGFGLGTISPVVMAAALGLAGGAMLYVTYCEIMPQTVKLDQGRLTAVFAFFGILAGLILTNLIGG